MSYSSQTLAKALAHLFPDGGWVCEDTYDSIEMDDGLTKPTEQEIIDAISVVDALSYKAERLKNYPDIGDQLDVLWKEFFARTSAGESVTSEVSDMLDKISAVKVNFPKL